MTGHIAGAGLLALDVVIYDECSQDALAFAGGTCGNVLSILSYLDWTSTAVGTLGDDEPAERLLRDLASVGVSAKHLVRDAQARTPVFFQTFRGDPGESRRHEFRQGSPPSQVIATPIRQFPASEAPDVFFMDRLSSDVLALAESAKAHGATVFYEPSSTRDAVFWPQAFVLADVVKYSHDRFTSEDLHGAMGSSGSSLWEIQTLGERGLRYRRHHEGDVSAWTASPAISAPRLVDTCGAGDWCTAGLVYGLASRGAHQSPEQQFFNAIRLGQALAAWACAFVGARGAMYGRDRKTTWRSIQTLVAGGAVNLSDIPTTHQGTRANEVSARAAWLYDPH